jgi:hypothetical protein
MSIYGAAGGRQDMQKRPAVRITLLLAASALWTAYALAQGAPPPPQAPLESITVTGVRPSQDAINSFLFSHATATRVTDKVARWSVGICPQTFGLGAKYAGYITQRIRSIAASVGAPVASDPTCRPNIQIVFTTTPQALLDNIRQNQPTYLGYHDNSTQAARLATVTRAV